MYYDLNTTSQADRFLASKAGVLETLHKFNTQASSRLKGLKYKIDTFQDPEDGTVSLRILVESVDGKNPFESERLVFDVLRGFMDAFQELDTEIFTMPGLAA